MKSKKGRIISILLVCSLIFAPVFLLNHFTLYTSDDYIYHFVYKGFMPTKHPEPIHGLISILHSQWNHYFLWNGRFVGHSIVQFFMQYDKAFFDVCNTFAFILLTCLMVKIAAVLLKRKLNAFVIFSVFVYLWFCIPEFGKTVLWVSGSGNYLWTGIIYTAFILFNLKSGETTPGLVFASFIFGFLSGATNENSGPVASVIVLLFILWRFLAKRKVEVWRLAGLAASFLGFLAIILSPGSEKRDAIHLTFSKIIGNFLYILKLNADFYWAPYLILLLLVFLLIGRNAFQKRDASTLMILLLGHFAGIYSLVLSPELPMRVFFGPTIFLGIGFAYVWYKVIGSFRNVKVRFLFAVPFAFLFCFHFLPVFGDVHASYEEVSRQYEVLGNTQNEDMELTFLSQPKTSYNAYNGTSNLMPDSKAWFNRWMSAYFREKSITGVESK